MAVQHRHASGRQLPSPLLQDRRVYTEDQVQTAYGINTLRAHASGTPVITVLDLGGGWLSHDLKLAGQCFGYSPPKVTRTQGDGVATAIDHADDETSLDLQTVAAVAPKAQVRVVQTTPDGVLDGFSRAVGDSRGPPDVISMSYGGCAFAENRSLPRFTSALDAVLAMTALTGVSSFVAAGDSGSTTCGTSTPGPTLSDPAVSPFVTAVGGTRLTLGPGNTRVSEVVWNDSEYGTDAAGGGGVTRLQPRPAYQDGVNAQNHRSVPDVSALADIVPGWPVVINSTLQTVGGTSGSTPLVAASTSLVDASQRAAYYPRIGLANGWFYKWRRTRGRSTTSRRATTISPAWDAARPLLAMTQRAVLACRTGPSCRQRSPSRAERRGISHTQIGKSREEQSISSAHQRSGP